MPFGHVVIVMSVVVGHQEFPEQRTHCLLHPAMLLSRCKEECHHCLLENAVNTKQLLATTCVLVFLTTSMQTSQAQSRTQNGATTGGVAGAIIGGIIGHQNDETPEGALIGGAVGALTGGLIGRAQDQEIQRQLYYQQQQQAYYAQQQAYVQQQAQQQAYAEQQRVASSGVSVADISNMSRSGLSDSVIIGHINARGIQRRLEVPEIIALHQSGVHEVVITAMQSAPLASQVAAANSIPAQQPTYQPPVYQQPAVQRQPTVVIEEPVIYRQPVVVERVYHRPYPVHHYRRGGASIRIGF